MLGQSERNNQSRADSQKAKIICPIIPKTSQFHILVQDYPHAPTFLHSPQAMVFLLRQLRMFFISVQCNFSVFLGVKRESNNKSHPCLEQASGTTGRLQLPRPPPPPPPPPPPLLSCSPSLMPVKGLSCRAWIHLCGTTTEKPPKALNSSSSPLPPSLHLCCYHHQLLSPSPLCSVFPSCTGELFRMNCCQLKACYSCEIAITQCKQGSA